MVRSAPKEVQLSVAKFGGSNTNLYLSLLDDVHAAPPSSTALRYATSPLPSVNQHQRKIFCITNVM